jgi:phage terminase large subunit-like protein
LNKRILVPLALLVLAALTLTACGGGGSSDEDKITETIETVATTSDPSNCTELETLAFVEQNSQQKGKAAVKACEEEAEAGAEQAEGANVSNVSVNGSKATAEAEFEGGSLGSQSLEVELVEEGGTWKLDQIAGFANYDGKALGEAFEKQFKEEPGELSPEQAKCISGKVAGLGQAEAEEVFFGGSPEKIIELAQSCA